MPDVGVHFGFPVAVDANDGRRARVLPARADSERMAIDGGLSVARATESLAIEVEQRANAEHCMVIKVDCSLQEEQG